MDNLSNTDIIAILEELRQGNYIYDYEYIGDASCGINEGEDGMYKNV